MSMKVDGDVSYERHMNGRSEEQKENQVCLFFPQKILGPFSPTVSQSL